MTPTTPLTAGMTYTAAIGPVTDLAGNAVVELGAWSFTARPVREHAVTLVADPSTLTNGSSIRLSGTVDGPLDGSLVLERVVAGGDWAPIAALFVPGTSGQFVRAIPASTTARFRARVTGSNTDAGVSDVVRVLVRRGVAIVGATGAIRRGSVGLDPVHDRLGGTVRPRRERHAHDHALRPERPGMAGLRLAASDVDLRPGRLLVAAHDQRDVPAARDDADERAVCQRDLGPPALDDRLTPPIGSDAFDEPEPRPTDRRRGEARDGGFAWIVLRSRAIARRMVLVAVTAGLLVSLLPATPVAADHIDLVFSTQPGDGLGGVPFSTQPVVTADIDGAPVNGLAITLSIRPQDNDAGGTLTCTGADGEARRQRRPTAWPRSAAARSTARRTTTASGRRRPTRRRRTARPSTSWSGPPPPRLSGTPRQPDARDVRAPAVGRGRGRGRQHRHVGHAHHRARDQPERRLVRVHRRPVQGCRGRGRHLRRLSSDDAWQLRPAGLDERVADEHRPRADVQRHVRCHEAPALLGPHRPATCNNSPPSGLTGGAVFPSQPHVRVVNASNQTVTSDNSTVVTLARTPGTPAQGGPGTLTCSNGLSRMVTDGIGQFTGCSIDRSGNGYRLRATGPALTQADSNTFTVAVGPAAKLAFVTQPTTGTALQVLMPPISVAVQDAGGNTVTTGQSAAVTLDHAAEPGRRGARMHGRPDGGGRQRRGDVHRMHDRPGRHLHAHGDAGRGRCRRATSRPPPAPRSSSRRRPHSSRSSRRARSSRGARPSF